MQEDHELEASVNYIARPCFQRKEMSVIDPPERFSSSAAVLAAGLIRNLSLHMSFS